MPCSLPCQVDTAWVLRSFASKLCCLDARVAALDQLRKPASSSPITSRVALLDRRKMVPVTEEEALDGPTTGMVYQCGGLWMRFE